MVMPVLLDDLRYMNDLLMRDRHRHIHNVLDASLLNSLLGYDLRHVDELPHDLLYVPLNSVYHFLRSVHVLHLRNFLHMHDFLDSWNFDNLLLGLTHDMLLLPIRYGNRSACFLDCWALTEHWLSSFMHRGGSWAMRRHRCPLGHLMRRPWHPYLPRTTWLCGPTLRRDGRPSMLAHRHLDLCLRSWRTTTIPAATNAVASVPTAVPCWRWCRVGHWRGGWRWGRIRRRSWGWRCIGHWRGCW